MSLHTPRLTTVSTGNEELDLRLGGGIPHPSLVLIEGENGTGKTALCTQFAKGYLLEELKVVYVTTENTVKQFLEQARNISIDLTDYFLKGQLTVFSSNIRGARWSRERARAAAKALVSFIEVGVGKYNAFILDSLSQVLHYLRDREVHTLLASLRRAVRMGATVIVTLHPGIVEERVVKEFAAASDVYLRLALGELGGRLVKVANIVKIRGAPTLAETSVAFDIDPAFGIKVVPLALAKV